MHSITDEPGRAGKWRAFEITLALSPCADHTVFMQWDVEITDQFADWFSTLSAREQEAIRTAVAFLEERGPGLGRPFVDTISGSRHPNMKELRPKPGNLRVFFAFDPRRTAIILCGGDKTDRWQAFYAAMVPYADDLYDAYLSEIEKEGLIE